MNVSLTELRAVSGGSAAMLTLVIEENGERQTVKGKISAALLSELSLPWQVNEPYPLDKMHCDAVILAMEKTAAIEKGLSLLDFGENTKRALRRKLISRGFSEESAEAAAEYLSDHGFIDEKKSAKLMLESLAERKLYGKKRIEQEMYQKGYEASVIRETLSESETDFIEICSKRIAKAGGLPLFSDRQKKQKAIASLMRYGFSFDIIREAISLLQEENR